MQTIYKYPFRINNEIHLDMHRGARILSVQVQNGTPCIWALVDTDHPIFPRLLTIHGTGHPIDHNMSACTFIGTIQLHDGALVFHVFDWGD